jgi:hypothetical protein
LDVAVQADEDRWSASFEPLGLQGWAGLFGCQTGRLVLAYFLLGVAVIAGNGALSPLLPLVVFSFWLLATAPGTLMDPRPPPSAMAWLMGFECALGLMRPIGSPLRTPALSAAYLAVTFALLLGLVRASLEPPAGRERRQLALLLGLYLFAGALVLRISPAPRVDVFIVEQQGAADLLAGRDPYLSSFPNPYNARETLEFFGAPVDALTHYPYPPLSLYATVLGHLLCHDVRLTFLVSQAITGLLLFRLARPSGGTSFAFGVLGLFLLHPRGTFVLEQAWTEPLISCAAVLLLLLAQGGAGPLTRGVALGFFLATKQYGALVFPLFARGRRPWSTALVGVAVAAFVTLPLFLRDVRGFIDDVVLFQVKQPFRLDALSVPAAVAWLTGWKAPELMSPVCAVLALVWIRSRLPGGARGLALGAALVYFALFLFAKQAFCNYYYFVGVLLLAAAASPGEAHAARVEEGEMPEAPPGQVEEARGG